MEARFSDIFYYEKSKEIPDNSIDLIFTDPPYETLYLYGELAKVAIRVLKPGGHLVIYVGGYELFEFILETNPLISPSSRLNVISIPSSLDPPSPPT